jgi:hypothetical protein
MDRQGSVLVLLCALLVATLAAPVVAQSAAGIDGLQYDGTPADRRNGVVYLWAGENHDFTATVTGDPSTEYQLCLDRSTGDGQTRLGCTTVTTTSNGSANATVMLDRWPAEQLGKQTVTATLSNGNETVGTKKMTVFVAKRAGDPDEDGLANEVEVESGTDMANADTDDDGLLDGAEVNKHSTDPTEPDTDGDGLADGREVNDLETNPSEADTDGDGITDGDEVNVRQTDPTESDTDGDTLSDGEELRTYKTDPKAADTDEDGLDDGKEVNVHETDPNSPDTDGDGLTDGEEINQYDTNPNKADTDGDGLGDGVEINKYSTNPNEADSDGDGVNDGTEVEQGSSPGGGSIPARLLPAWLPHPALFFGALVALLVGAAIVSRRLRVGDDSIRGPDADDTTAPIPEREGPTPSVTGDGPATTPAPSSPSGETTTATEPSTDSTAGTADAYLTDEERVVKMLRESGGRLPQSAVVDETDWSKSKVSRLLSGMADDGQIRKIDLGGRNLITLPDAVPDSARSREEREEREE